jgi:hypothetical protein
MGARLMAGSEPWAILGRGLEQCRAILNDRDYLVFTSASPRSTGGPARSTSGSAKTWSAS